MRKKSGFTLAEVLITLAVIGVVAALTVPTLIQTTNNAEFEAKLKSDSSYISQAFNMLSADYGGDMGTAFGNSHDSMMNAFGTKIVFVKTCLSNQDPGVCWHDGYNGWKNLYNNPPNSFSNPNSLARAILNNGAMIVFVSSGGLCTGDQGDGPLDKSVCGYLYIDVNGFQGPNIVGRDIFRLHITKTGIYPTGISVNTYSNWNDWSTYCNKTNSATLSGISCAAKILQGRSIDN